MAELPEQDRTPESAAITGGAPAAAEPSPQVRGREATSRSMVYVLVILGVALLYLFRGRIFALLDHIHAARDAKKADRTKN